MWVITAFCQIGGNYEIFKFKALEET